MKVTISNLNDGQVVCYNVIVIKGSIIGDDEDLPAVVGDDERGGFEPAFGRSLSTESCSSGSRSSSRERSEQQRSPRYNSLSKTRQDPYLNETVFAYLKNFDRHEKFELDVKVVRNRFVCVVELSEGVNCIFFQDEIGRNIREFRIKYLPSSNDHYIKPLYVFCSDSYPSQNHEGDHTEALRLNRRKIYVGLKLVQCVYAEKLFEWGFSRRTFSLGEQDSYLSCEILRIPYTTSQVRELDTKRLWDALAREIRTNRGIWDEQCKYVAFMADPWKPQAVEILENSPALAGGGLALLGSDFLQVWPDQFQQVLTQLNNAAPIDVTNFTFGAIGKTTGALLAASLGGLAHEMGHIFDLGHTERGLMGNQYHRVDLTFSPLVSYPKAAVRVYQSDEERQIRPKVCLSNGRIADDCVSLSLSCATLLFFHRWFRSTPCGPPAVGDPTGVVLTKNIVSSKVGLSVIEIRDLDNGSILRSWTFDRVKIRTEFPLGKSTIPSDQTSVDIVAQDFNGNILKFGMDRNALPESFTHLRRRNL